MSWRITFSEIGRGTVATSISVHGTVKENTTLKSPGKLELRENDGTIVRLGANTDFILEDTPFGLKPIYGRGPVFISRKGGCGKYRTSCWLREANQLSERPDIFIKPSTDNNTDEFYAVTGDIIIYEFDEEMKTFTICTLREGEKAHIIFDNKATKMVDRYSAKVSDITDAEYDFILKEYIDRRNWI